jgi:hypothetical protein
MHFKQFWGEIRVFGYYFGIFIELVEENYFSRKVEIFSQGIYYCFWKN